jgi:DNA-binding response OmpR family regulator
MKWNASMSPRIPEAVDYTEWRPTVSDKNKRKRDTLQVKTNLKARRAKLEQEKMLEEENEVRYLANNRRNLLQRNNLLRLVWDARDYSCGYDATFTILDICGRNILRNGLSILDR